MFLLASLFVCVDVLGCGSGRGRGHVVRATECLFLFLFCLFAESVKQGDVSAK